MLTVGSMTNSAVLRDEVGATDPPGSGARTKRIAQGDTFEVGRGLLHATFRRELDDPTPAFECERIRVTCLTHACVPGMKPYTFGAEPAWFYVRGLSLAEDASPDP